MMEKETNKIKLIACIDENGIIGKKNQNKMLWKLPEDLNHFKEKTENNVVVMGFNTFVSLDLKFLKNRYNIVLVNRPTRFVNRSDGEFISIKNFNIDKIKERFPDKDIWIIGGLSIYNEFINKVDEIWLSVINKSYKAKNTSIDDYLIFPKIDRNIYNLFFIDCKKAFEIRQYIRK